MKQSEPNTTDTERTELLGSFTGEADIDLLAQATNPMLAMALLEHFPGIELRVPHKMHEEHELALALGIEYATHLCLYAGGSQVNIPTKHPASKHHLQHRVARMKQQGKTGKQIALACGISQRHVRRLAASVRQSLKITDQTAAKALPAPPESVFNGGLTGGLVDFGPYDPLPDPKPSQRASESKHGFYTPQPKKDQS